MLRLKRARVFDLWLQSRLHASKCKLYHMRIARVPNSQVAVIMFLTTLSLQQLTHDHACIHACGLPKIADRKTK